jgi:3',5'-cyclic AMP phosphodiesterase CpdA
VDPITILHISDPQFGKNHLFGTHGHLPSDKIADSLSERLLEDLQHLSKTAALRPDILLLTGDISEWGVPSEFKMAKAFLEQLCSSLHIDRQRVVLLPGNHDVNRAACEAYFLQCRAEETSPQMPYWPKLANYVALHNSFYADYPHLHYTEEKPWALFALDDLQVVIAAMNSDMAESHLEENHYGWLGEKQLIWFSSQLEEYKNRNWLRIAAVHHNVLRGATNDDENLRDADALRRRLFPNINVLFHGHTHNGGRLTVHDSVPVISTGSAGVVRSARPEEVPNQYQFVRILPDKIEQFARHYVVTESRWLGDNRVSVDGNSWRHKDQLKLSGTEATFRKHRIRNLPSSKKSDQKPPVKKTGTQKRDRKVGALPALRIFFSTGTAESEGNVLNEAFVTPNDYLEIISPPAASPRILVGKKGSGKSAFITYFLSRAQDASIPALLLRPDDLRIAEAGGVETLAQTKAIAYESIVRAMAFHLWVKVSTLLSTEHKNFLSEIEKREKLSDVQLSKLTTLLGEVGADISQVDDTALFGTEHDSVSRDTFDALLSPSSRMLYLLIDDTDQIASPSAPGHLNRIWGFLLAVRRLSDACKNIKCIVTLRSEIWRRLEIDPLGQRDQMDHFRPLIHRLNPTKSHIKNILERRLEVARSHVRGVTDASGADYYGSFFEGNSVTIPTTNETSNWKEFLLVRSRNRPRDAIQLVALLAKTAQERSAAKINSEHAAIAMIEFSEGRARDIAVEVGEDCPQFFEVVKSLWPLPFKSTVEKVRLHLMTIPTMFSVKLGGIAMQADSQQDTIKLWHLLYESGVLNARIADSRQPDGFRHIDPLQDPSLVSQERWNDMQAVIWEINPAYRDFLLQIEATEKARDGLPPLTRNESE